MYNIRAFFVTNQENNQIRRQNLIDPDFVTKISGSYGYNLRRILMPFQENKAGSRAVYELFVNFWTHRAKNITVRGCTVTIWSTFLCRFRKTIFFEDEDIVFLIRDQNVVIQCGFCKRFLFSSRESASAICSRRLCRESRFTMSGRCGRLFRPTGGRRSRTPAGACPQARRRRLIVKRTVE